VSYTLLDSQDFIDEMRTGLYAIDLFLKSVNPDKARAKARVFSTDTPRARRSTPKALKLGASALDIVVPAAGTGSTNVSLSSINGLFILSGGWAPEVIIRNYGETASKTIDGAGVITDPTTTARTVSNKSLTSNVATLTTSTEHGFYVGTSVVVAGVDATFNGTYTITQVPTPTTFRYAKTNANVVSAVATGTASSTTDDRITVSVTYDDALSILKMVDPGTWELYGTRTVGATTETTLIATGNLKIGLASSVINAYTIG
jgi:hypothetical protein